jgi:hypothetical protein
MVKRVRKQATKPELRQAWLRRYELDGESPPQIAARDGYDVRTVRKQIEVAKEEREKREARSIVLRNALESHYADLCKYAEDLNSTIMGENKLSKSLDPYMEVALRQHLPRSPIWKELSKLAQLNKKIDELEDNVKKRLNDEIGKDQRLKRILAEGESQAITGITEVIVFQVKAWAQGQLGLNIKDNFKTRSAENGFASVQYGFAQMGIVKEGHVTDISEVLEDFESKITDWGQFEDMRKSYAALIRVKTSLQDELAIITHKRIVPGKCKYCPI